MLYKHLALRTAYNSVYVNCDISAIRRVERRAGLDVGTDAHGARAGGAVNGGGDGRVAEIELGLLLQRLDVLHRILNGFVYDLQHLEYQGFRERCDNEHLVNP